MSSKVRKASAAEPLAVSSWRPSELPAEPQAPPAPGNPARQEPPPEIPIEQIRTEAFSQGYAQGEAAGRQAVQPLIDKLSNLLVTLASLRSQLRKQAEADVVRLALAIARRILRRELHTDPDALLGIVRAALEKLETQEIYRVRTDPMLAEAVRKALSAAGAPESLEVLPEASRAPGDLIFETAQGNLDASVETQLAEIERGLADRLKHA